MSQRVDSAIAASPSSDPPLTAETIQHFAAVVGLLYSALRWCCSRIAWRLSPQKWGERGGSDTFADRVEVPFWDFFGILSEKKPRQGHNFSFCRCVVGAEDVGAEHYGPDNRCSAQCNGIRRVQNSMQGHHSRSHGPEKETLGLWVSLVQHSFRK